MTRAVLCLIAGLVAPIAGVVTYQIAATGVVPMTEPGMAFVILGQIITPLANPFGAAFALMPTVSLACLAAARSPVHRQPGEYGVVDGTWLAAKWGTPAALPIVLILGIREPVGAIITLLFLVPLVAGTTWSVGVALSFVDMLGVIAADAVTPQERAFRRGDATLD